MNHMPDKQFVEMLYLLSIKQIPCKMGHRVDSRQYRIMKCVVGDVMAQLKTQSREEYMAFDKWIREVMPTMLAPGEINRSEIGA